MIAAKGGRGRVGGGGGGGGKLTISKDVMSIRGSGKNFLEIGKLSKTRILVHYKVEINQIT